MMKIKFLAACGLASFLSTQAMAAQANLFNCTTQDDSIKLHYTSASIIGKAVISLKVGDKTIVPPTSDESRVIVSRGPTPLGTMISVSLRPKSGPEAQTKIYSVFVPTVDLGRKDHTTFETYMLEGQSTEMQDAPFVKQQIAKTVKVTCVARAVAFVTGESGRR